ncbi:MAG: zinc ribbon domain-containing protein [Prevotella sp.]|nr:zinc ribbon domain-containing protein [Prevotella sp.]
MALIKCKECGHEVSDKASSCPNCGYPMESVGYSQEKVLEDNPKKKKGWVWFLIVALLCLIGGGGYYVYSQILDENDENDEKEAQLNLTKGMVDNTTYSEEGRAESVNSNTDEGENIAGVLKKGNWAYSNSTDPMTDKVVNAALCMSNESQAICNKRTYLQLYLMHMPMRSNSVFVQIEKGVLRQDKLPMIYFRFDGGKVDTFAVMANGAKAQLIPSEKISNVIINSLKKSKKCAIKVEAQDGGTATYTFNTEGLEWDY